MRHIARQINNRARQGVDRMRSAPEPKVASRDNVGFIFTRVNVRWRPSARRNFLIQRYAGSMRLRRCDGERHRVTEHLE